MKLYHAFTKIQNESNNRIVTIFCKILQCLSQVFLSERKKVNGHDDGFRLYYEHGPYANTLMEKQPSSFQTLSGSIYNPDQVNTKCTRGLTERQLAFNLLKVRIANLLVW